ncbi:hypothetical protein NEOLEDRAFT_1239657 [Neolentinus lepideus HHB14362 ss-1]|uniref:Sds3-like-domain-containing protein n=1 Tax=Neolentinus lepideus HHB14362 ss-1 TaxID=1314782 RepID=A0A165UKB6_9AGAM|nr:hypothetical protein NEOLEDRAFT_1239657 [Neolentinus lepideus HHB14362 ss-1]
MPNSIASSEPLSSPSPSPPPPAAQHPTHAGLDTDGSELSELTDDEQDSENRGSGEQDDETRTPRRSGKKKRGSLVPAPMWDWAYKQKRSDDRGEMVEEEEEEDEDLSRSGTSYPRAMEEEEDEEDSFKGEIVEVGKEGRHRDVKRSGSPRDMQVDAPNPTIRRSIEPAANAMDDAAFGSEGFGSDHGGKDEGESEADMDDDHDSIRFSRPDTKENTPDLTDNEQEEGDNNVEEEEEEDDSRPITMSARVEEEEEVESEEAESEDEPDNAEHLGDHDIEGDQEVDPPPIPVKRVTPPITASMDPNEDITAPKPGTVVPLQEKAAASSIMAGASVIDAPSPTSSDSARSSVQSSPSSSRSASPEPGSGNRRKRKKRTTEPGADKAKSAPLSSGPLDVKADDGDVEDADKDAVDGDQDADVEADIEADAVDDDEVDEHEMESELQPAHRAEALDVLAKIEFRFALLRERLYMEKMEGLAWEEALITEDNHPELLVLQAELAKRRDKRLELAAKRRSYEVTMVTRKRKADEDGVWSWWKFSRDELQTEMISETNRKRRRLERARRASERPQPMRRIPDSPMNVPPAPTLREVVKSTPFASLTDPSSRGNSKRDTVNTRPLVYPQLSSLSSAEIGNDLELIWQQRRRHVDARSMNPPMGPPLTHAYDPGYGPIDGGHYNVPGSSRVPPPFPPLMQGYPGPSGSSRMQHHHAGPSGLHQSHLPMDQDLAMTNTGPPSSAPYAQPLGAGMRRSLSPVHVTANGASNGWLGGSSKGKPPGHSDWMKDSRRPSGGKDEYGDRDRERDRARERSDRERAEWEQRERDRYQMQMLQSQPVRPSHALHGGPGSLPHAGPPNHHHHHHHIHHHHHPASSLGGTPGPSVGGNAPSPRVSILSRDFDSGRPHSGPPTTEIINLQSSKRSPNGYWKAEELDSSRDRVRPQANQHPLDDRSAQHILAPVQLMGGHGPPIHAPSAPASMAPSPRGPWSAADDMAMRRPSSATMSHQPSMSGRSSPGPLLGSVHGMRGPPPPSGSRQTSLNISSPRTTKPPPPTSPVSSSPGFPGPLRSPSRSSHTLPSGPTSLSSSTTQLPAHPSVLSGSPASRPARPPSPPSLSKMIHPGGPGGPSPLSGPARPVSPMSRSANIDTHPHSTGPSPPFNGSNRTTTPLSLFPGHPAPSSKGLPSDHSSPQLNNVPPPKMNVVQLVDGS